MEPIGGITPIKRKTNLQKASEPHAFDLFKNRAGRVAFQYRTRHDIVTDGEWQGGDGGIPLFKVGRAATRRYCVVVRSCVLLRH